jgi:IS5 family transposase
MSIEKVVKWREVEALLMEHHETGASKEGADAYPALMLLKALLLQKWFRIPSDPELENQINDRISFKKFLGLPLDRRSPDHSTFSIFRSRLSKEAMTELNSLVLQEFSRRGLSLNEGIAIDARLVKSASRPMSKEGLRELKERRETAEGKVDKKGNPLKFSRDVGSDWTVKNEALHNGLKEHASIDVKSGFVLATTMTAASVHDSNYLAYLTLASCHTQELVKKVHVDKGYHGEPNRSFLHLNEIEDGVMCKDTTTAKITQKEIKRNRKIAKKRYIVEQYFGLSHLQPGAYRAGFTAMIKNIWDAMCRQTCPVKCEAYFAGMAFNLFRGSRLIVET